MERGKSRKGLIIVLLILFMVAGAGVCSLYLLRTDAADENKESVLEEGQEYAYVKITSISGNEMEYTVLEAQEVEFNDMQGKEHGSKDSAAQDKETPFIGETSDNIGSMPSGGGMPDMGSMPSGGRMPDMGSMPSGGRMPSGDKAEGNEEPDAQKYPNREVEDNTQNTVIMIYTDTDETGQMQIPVGTEVETKLGTITTFSRLSNGDIIRMLLQKDDTGNKVLMKIRIME